MNHLLRMFAEIAIWRRGPQDLPASTTLLGLVALFYVLVSVVQAALRDWSLPSTAMLLVIDLGMQFIVLWALLKLLDRRARFLQTTSAFLGVSALLTLLDAVVTAALGMLGIPSESAGNLWPYLSLGILLMSLGRILQLALERSLFLCMMLVLVIMLTISWAAQNLVPGL